MKQFTSFQGRYWQSLYCLLLVLVCVFTACHKNDISITENKDATKYPSDVIDKWITMQLRLMRDATGIPNVMFSRYYGYTGVAAFEALSPGTRLSEQTNGKWNGLSGLPREDLFKKYYWPASVNASLASINRNIFIKASLADKAAIDSLETALQRMVDDYAEEKAKNY